MLCYRRELIKLRYHTHGEESGENKKNYKIITYYLRQIENIIRIDNNNNKNVQPGLWKAAAADFAGLHRIEQDSSLFRLGRRARYT